MDTKKIEAGIRAEMNKARNTDKKERDATNAASRVNAIANAIRSKLRASESQKGQGPDIITHLGEFMAVSGDPYKINDKTTQTSIISVFVARLSYVLTSTPEIQVRYESDDRLHIQIDGKWFELLRQDFIVNLLAMARAARVPDEYLDSNFVKPAYKGIIETFKRLDKNYKPISKLLE